LVPESSDVDACDELNDHGERYLDRGELGRGGMGEIRIAFDLRLGRNVAIKSPAVKEPALVRQFVAEAKLTARLSHPGIVAIHDAGIGRDGRPYYTMPVIEGRSLALAAASEGLEGRLRLVRHFLHACEAVAYAHSERIVHRDLKPANILVGRFGETLVVDWGLAGPLGERAPGVFGTPSYMAPEQVCGDPIDASADVYALGVSLREIVTGSRRRGREGPAELLAIVDRATQPEASLRYANAGELASDLAAWFEGRRVAAHRYGVRELLARMWTAHRAVLTIAMVSIVGIAVAIVVGVLRADRERARAQASEQQALVARGTAEQALADALVAHALAAAREDDWPAAELFAVAALRHGPSELARGVLAQFDGATRPVRIATHALPGCKRVLSSPEGDLMLCIAADGPSLGRLDDGWHELSRLPTALEPVALAGGHVLLREEGGAVVVAPLRAIDDAVPIVPRGDVRDLQTAGVHVGWITAANESWARIGDDRPTVTQWCASAGRGAAGALALRPDGARLVACQNGTIFFAAPGVDSPEPLLVLPAHLGGPADATFEHGTGPLAAIAMTKGTAAIIDVTTGRLVQTIARSAVMPSALALVGNRFAIADDERRVDVWDVHTGVRVARIAAQAEHLQWLDGGTTLRIVSGNVEDYRLPSTAPRALVQRDVSGIAALAVASDGEHFATAHGDGHVRVGHVRHRQAVAEIPLHWSVAKDVGFTADATRLVAVHAQDSALRIVELGESIPSRAIDHFSSARATWLVGDLLLSVPYGHGIAAWRDGESTGSYFESLGHFIDLEADPDQVAATALANGGEIVRIWATGETQLVAWRDDAIAVSGSGEDVLVLRVGLLERLDASGESRGQVAVGDARDVAVDPDHRLVAVAHTDGTVSLWDLDRLERLAVLHAHGGRVSAIAFDPSGAWLVSAGWDGAVRQWSMRDIRRDPEALAREIEGAWGRVHGDLVASSADR
jgi:WD40 repeat protein